MTVVSWNNFMCYYNCYQLTGALIDWVNDEIDILIGDVRAELITDEVIKSIIVNEVTLGTFEKIIKKFRIEEFNDSLHEFTPEKINVMVKERYIPFSIKLLDEMKEITPEFVGEYIVYNKECFFENIDSISLDLHTIAQLLCTNELDNKEKLKLFGLFNAEDVDREVALVIRNMEFTVPKSYVESAWEILAERDRYQLLLNQLEVYSLDEISDKLSSLAWVYQKLSGRDRRHKEYLDIDSLGYNKHLLQKLKEVDYLTSVETETFIHEKEERQRFVVWVKKK